MEIPTEVAKNETQSLVNLVKKEAGYLCCFNSYAQEFEGRKERLNAELADVRRRIDKARGASHVTSAALQWKGEAEILIAGDTEKEKCFNDLCLNCWRQYRKGKDLAKRTLEIGKLLDRSNVIEDGAADLLGIKYHCIPTFMDFESRNSTFQDLKKALEDEENNIIGLHGLGGTGKTTMAKEVGAHLEGSTFGKVIFVVVSKPPDFKKLRREIARKLELELKDGEEEALQDRILAKIIALKEKLLIVLDDLWEEFDLNKELGIPLHHLHKRCTVLITTRNKDICPKMECQKEIHLEALTSEEALSLFLKHTNNSFNLDSLAPKIVKHCHGIPVVIVAVARSLKGRPDEVWKEALRNLESGDESILTVNDDLKEVYKGLKLSYDNLKHKKARELFLISSLFPEDFEIPKESLFRIGVGMGRFGEDDDYKKRRRNAIDAIVELQDSSLLLNAEMECVKMHDLVHEVALLIRKQNIQPVVESEQPREEGWKCLFCKNNDFPKQSDGGKLEILIMFLDPSCFSDLKVPDTFFSEMTKLKVLFLQTRRFLQISAPSLFPLIQSLQDLRTLKLRSFKSCCISMLGKLLNLETLWLDNCSINKLPEEKFELEKLRFLRIENCEIKMNNPFELIKACPKLEELTFLDNEYDKMENKDTISQKVSFHELDIYQISSEDLSDYFDQYGSLLSRCFQPGDSVHLISEATFKQLARTPELLILEGYEKTEHKNLIPDIVSVDDRGKTDLIILKLDSCPSMQCLIDGMNNHLYVNAFSNLVELSLYQMGLSDMLFNGNYNLCHLKTMKLKDCPKLTSIFLPSTARSLSLLEELKIKGCGALECILEDKSSRGEIIDDDGDNDQKSYGAMFSKLKILVIKSCGNLEKILPIIPDGGLLKSIAIRKCEKLKYIFDKFQELNVMLSPDLKMELSELPSLVGIFREYKKSISSSLQQPASTASSTKTRSLSWAQVCCFKSRATSEEANGAISTQEVDASTDRGAPSLAAQSLLVQAVKNVRKIKLFKCGNIISLSTLSIAASATALKTLTIRECHKLKCITTHEGNALGDKNNLSIFPTLEDLEIEDCEELEILFVSSISVGLEKLKSLTVEKVPKLKYVVGNCQKELYPSNQNQNDELCFNLPALETLNIQNAPMMNCICSKNYKLGLSSSLDVDIRDCGIKSFPSYDKIFDASTDRGAPSLAAQNLLVQAVKNVRKIKLFKCGNIISLSTLFIAASATALKTLTIRECHKLKCITTHEGNALGGKNNLSIFPTLEDLKVEDCEELEILFVSSISVGLEKLKSLTVEKVPKLKYVVGNCQKELYPSNQNQNDELCFNLPALETLYIQNAPMMNCICSKNYKLGLSSSLDVDIRDCGIKSFPSYDKIFDASTDRGAPSLAAQSLLVQAVKNVRKIKLFKCGNIISLSTLSIAASATALKTLTIRECHKLKCITTHEGNALGDKNNLSIFPTLEDLKVEDCEELKILFVSSISVGLEKLKSLTVEKVPKLKYVVGNCQKELYPSNQNQNDELCFNLPALETLYIQNAPMMNCICSKNYKLGLSSSLDVDIRDCGIKSFPSYDKIFDASTDRGAPSLAAQSLLVQLVKNVREIELVECGNIISLSTLSIAASATALKTLTIRECHKLKCITTHEGNALGDKNNLSIFPTLEDLEIEDCKELEILFVSSISVGLEKLKSLTVEKVPKLKYVVGNYQKELYPSNQNQNDELCFNLPALETLNIQNAPMMNCICSKKYNIVNLTATEEVHTPTIGAPLFHVTHNLLKTIREIKLVECTDLISMTTLSIASTILLEVLTIRACGQLKCIVADEGDARTQINYNSVFPKLKRLEVLDCDALEYLFPAYAFRSPLYLESLKINEAPMLKYVFGRSQHGDSLNPNHQNIQTLIDFPALKRLSIGYLPKLVSIFPKKYYMRGLYLRFVTFEELPKFTMRPFNELLVCWHTEQHEMKVIEMCWKTLESVQVCDSKIEEIFDLTYMETKKKGDELQPLKLLNLSKLVNICVGPKCIIRFDSLRVLTIKACKKLRVIFSASTVRSLPMLDYLDISECEELVHIIEEDYERNADDHEPCFPKLERVYVSHCHKLKYLFSITISDILPKLRELRIREANELEHVLIKRDAMEEMFMKNVLPRLRRLALRNLPNLFSVCHGINFQEKYYDTKVYNCPKFETSTTQYQADPETGNSQVEEKAKERLSSHMVEEIAQQSLTKGATEEIVEEDFMSDIAKATISSSDSKLTGPLVAEARAKGVSSNTLYQISLTSEKEVPIHTSLNLTVLPTSDSTHSFAKIFEEEEEEQGGLITSRRLQSGIKASSCLLEDKHETSINGDPFAPPVTTVLSEQTSQATVPPSPISSKASTSLNQTPPSILSRASDNDDVQVYDKSHPHSTNLFEGVDHGDIKEAGMVQNEYKSNVEPSSLTRGEQESPYSKDQLTDSQPSSAIPTTPFIAISQDEYLEIVEVRGEEGALILETPHPSSLTSKEEPIPMSLNFTFLSRSPSTNVKIFEEEEKGGLITTPRHESDMKAVSSLPPRKERKTSNQGDPFVPPMLVISSERQASDTILPLSFVPSKALMSPKQISMSTSSQSTYSGRNVQENVGTINNQPLHETLDAIQISSQLAECGSSELASSICDTKNASSVVGMKEIVNMMKLEGDEPSILAEAFKAKPQLCLSSEDRSTELLCYSYRVLINILNILATRSPFTITEVDKRLLVKNLKDASILGFDKDWLKSIRIKVFNCDASELHHKQQVLKSLGNNLEANKRELANVRNQEAKATQSVEIAQKDLEATHKELEAAFKGLEAAQSHLNVAQQQYANIRVRHSQLLEECQEILEQRDQCTEIIAAKLRPFGF